MAKIFTQTPYYPAIESGKHIENVLGCFIEEETLDIWQSKKSGKQIFKKRILLNITVQTGAVKDIVSHEILDKDEKSETLKKRFADAWQSFINNPGKVVVGANEAASQTKKELDDTKNALDQLTKNNENLTKKLEEITKNNENLTKKLEKITKNKEN
ncbi:MAG: hypothetical protein LBD46_07820 [Endomicrobium sp.]|jgi:hypothetical protein|nr:hypothetical protein [Endomicrobium sp.]